MSSGTYQGIPREKILWEPKIDAELCTGCGECLDFCTNNVFELNEEENIMVVKNPMNCVVGCNKCAGFCTTGALTFPEIKELVEVLRELRKEYQK